ncbi:MAG: hypothetical protein KF910_14090 [Brevundimonas sp.]|uniref:hypothetical protein n=1 Tax=Brevundimonas sp. TaxID=1871086 RepID=UPI0025C122B3|nr:hypothetical protein [Brevundimonas sp.]MBX3476805.1 hypothetical protein [Brevundimonas sp.]MBX3478732.1 hypothetical protein [Brevundimonas sp.]
MRRFFVWSALSALIGLLLAGGGYWAYWNFYARFQPVTLTRHQAEIQRLLDEASWVSGGGGGQPLYVVGYRDSAATQAYEQEEGPKLRAAGVETRVVLFARPDREGLAQSTAAERATIAELWLSRDWTLYQRWTATPSRQWTAAGVPAADGNLARSAVVEASRQFSDRLGGLLRDAGVSTRYPLIIWRDREGFLKACACTDKRSWAFIRDDLDAPDRLEPAPVADPDAPAPFVAPGDGAPESLSYPTLAPIPPAGAVTDPTVTPETSSAPRAPTPRAAPRPAPEPKMQEDSTFF